MDSDLLIYTIYIRLLSHITPNPQEIFPMVKNTYIYIFSLHARASKSLKKVISAPIPWHWLLNFYFRFNTFSPGILDKLLIALLLYNPAQWLIVIRLNSWLNYPRQASLIYKQLIDLVMFYFYNRVQLNSVVNNVNMTSPIYI